MLEKIGRMLGAKLDTKLAPVTSSLFTITAELSDVKKQVDNKPDCLPVAFLFGFHPLDFVYVVVVVFSFSSHARVSGA